MTICRQAQRMSTAVMAFLRRNNNARGYRLLLNVTMALWLWFAHDVIHWATPSGTTPSPLWVAVDPYLAWIGTIASLLTALFAVWDWRRSPTPDDFRAVVGNPSSIPFEAEIFGLAYAVKPAQLKEMEQLFQDVLAQRGHVRSGHLVWILDVLERKAPPRPIPDFTPSPDEPYSLDTDIGGNAVRTFFGKGMNGEEIPPEVYELVQRFAEKGSPLAMHVIGLALIDGVYPGRAKNVPGGIMLLERVVGLPHPPKETLQAYARLLSTHPDVPRDEERAFQLQQRANVIRANS